VSFWSSDDRERRLKCGDYLIVVQGDIGPDYSYLYFLDSVRWEILRCGNGRYNLQLSGYRIYKSNFLRLLAASHGLDLEALGVWDPRHSNTCNFASIREIDGFLRQNLPAPKVMLKHGYAVYVFVSQNGQGEDRNVPLEDVYFDH